MAHRSHSLLRGLYNNVQHHGFSNFARRSGRDAVGSSEHAEHQSKPERTNSSQNLCDSPQFAELAEPTSRDSSGFDNELFSDLIDLIDHNKIDTDTSERTASAGMDLAETTTANLRNLQIGTQRGDGRVSHRETLAGLSEAELCRLLEEGTAAEQHGDYAADWTTSIPAAGCAEISVPLLNPMYRDVSNSSLCSNAGFGDFRGREISTSSLCSNMDFSDFRGRDVSTASNFGVGEFRGPEISSSSNFGLGDFRGREISTSSMCSNVDLSEFRVREYSTSSLCAGIDFSDFRTDCVTNEDTIADADQLPEEFQDTALSVTTVAMERCSLSPLKVAPPEETQVVAKPTIGRTRKSSGNTRVRIRKRPWKNVREKRRRAEIKDKYEQLYNLCQNSVDAKGLRIPLSGSDNRSKKKNSQKKNRHKMDILSDVVKSMEILDKQLIELRNRNKKLKSASASSTFK